MILNYDFYKQIRELGTPAFLSLAQDISTYRLTGGESLSCDFEILEAKNGFDRDLILNGLSSENIQYGTFEKYARYEGISDGKGQNMWMEILFPMNDYLEEDLVESMVGLLTLATYNHSPNTLEAMEKAAEEIDEQLYLGRFDITSNLGMLTILQTALYLSLSKPFGHIDPMETVLRVLDKPQIINDFTKFMRFGNLPHKLIENGIALEMIVSDEEGNLVISPETKHFLGSYITSSEGKSCPFSSSLAPKNSDDLSYLSQKYPGYPLHTDSLEETKHTSMIVHGAGAIADLLRANI